MFLWHTSHGGIFHCEDDPEFVASSSQPPSAFYADYYSPVADVSTSLASVRHAGRQENIHVDSCYTDSYQLPVNTSCRSPIDSSTRILSGTVRRVRVTRIKSVVITLSSEYGVSSSSVAITVRFTVLSETSGTRNRIEELMPQPERLRGTVSGSRSA